MQTMRWIDGWVGLVRRWPALLVFWGALSFAFGALAATDNKSCLECHDAKAPKIEVPDAQGKPRKPVALAPDAFGKGVHGKMDCVACHKGIKESPAAGSGHKKFDPPQDTKPASCADGHQQLWDEAKKYGKAQAKPRLGVVAENIEAYRKSFHARPQTDDKTKPNASCDGCQPQ